MENYVSVDVKEKEEGGPEKLDVDKITVELARPDADESAAIVLQAGEAKDDELAIPEDYSGYTPVSFSMDLTGVEKDDETGRLTVPVVITIPVPKDLTAAAGLRVLPGPGSSEVIVPGRDTTGEDGNRSRAISPSI